ncbi:DUF4349 domain-containing protein [Microbacterium neungamense]|uniref:DUF4349 domain-containing protein n=1 Tax=Microbacterium neungamense TaxID=2810535 RepID=UPI00217EEC1E|nr:DUF4349 domain-containing protein [Microbacterium neungamense]UWF78433.1 DUF4349 domain-containing protein [Microbacterium neungamense]
MSENVVELPPLSEESIERIERRVFAEIESERPPRRGARRRARAVWTGLGIAAAFAVGVAVTPPLLSAVSPASDDAASTYGAEGGSSGGAADSATTDAGQGESATAPEGVTGLSGGSAQSDRSAATDEGGEGREIIAAGQLSLEVRDIPAAVDGVEAVAEEHGGYVEATDVGGAPTAYDATVPSPVPPDGEYGWVTIRVPSADLTAVMDELGEIGDVVRSSVSRQDVTSTAVDLRARVEATRASVQRLTELMARSATVAELIEAEVALTDRQAQLESYEQELKNLEEQVAMSSVRVELSERTAAETADPAGFADGLLAGWNGLVASLNAVVIAVGFALPWLAVAGVVFLVVWLIRRGRRRARAMDEAQNP